ncbi:MAG: PP2C family protein-serine/threonine phosphatase [Vicinamibacterales bacterium]
MPIPVSRPLLSEAPRPPWTRVLRWLRTTLAGRLLLVGLAAKVLEAAGAAAAGGRPAWVQALDAAGTLAIVLVAGYLAARGAAWMRRRLLWRVRRKLILSYVFVGLVPSLLIVTFFLTAGLLLVRSVASYLVQTRLAAQAEQARFLAQTTLLEVQRATSPAAVRETLERQQANASGRYPFLSIAIVPARDVACPGGPGPAPPGRTPPGALPVTVGWTHVAPPSELPRWITCEGTAGLVAYDAASEEARARGVTDIRLVARAAAVPATRAPGWAVVLDLPISDAVERRLQQETGIQFGAITDTPEDTTPPVTARGRALDARPVVDFGSGVVAQLLRRWVVVIEHRDWRTGATGSLTMMLAMNLVDMYQRIAFQSQLSTALNGLALAVLGVLGVLFLVIQGVALVLGLTLARQITGAVHDLFTGTEHLRNRDFTHVIPVRARDQLGELADSFNVMTGEITRLLTDVAQKERLEQEFATAREIQMKLLPHGPLAVPGLAVSAYCEPAREVGGDYYDVFPVSDGVVGFLIADVSGKGVGAGLYMAQLKGLVLSLVRQHSSPRDLLVAVNRVLVDRLDGRSFITMSYLVVDLNRQVMTYARAGHCPLLLVPAARGGLAPPVKVLAPDGLVVGLTLDDGSLFESLLEEVTVPLAAGDLVVLYTDGMSEMMNPQHDCYGEARLGEQAGRHRDLPLDQLAGRLVADVRAFGAGAGQHDDMTMLLLRVEPRAAGALEPAGPAVEAAAADLDEA